MNSWQIIKDFFIGGFTPDTFGYLRAVDKASTLFVLLLSEGKLEQEAKDAFNKDEDAKQAILSRVRIQELKDAGIIY